MEVFQSFTFDAAHRLTNAPQSHKCERLHGHTFRIDLYVSAPLDDESGWVMDFGDIKKVFKPIYEQLDHNYLNDIPGLENPTSENIARWIWCKLKYELPILSKIVVQESPRSGAIYEGEDE